MECLTTAQFESVTALTGNILKKSAVPNADMAVPSEADAIGVDCCCFNITNFIRMKDSRAEKDLFSAGVAAGERH